MASPYTPSATATSATATSATATSETGTPATIAETNVDPKPVTHAETEWKITIQNSDGTTSEVLLSPVSDNEKQQREIKIIFAGGNKMGEPADAEKVDATKDTSQISRRTRIWQIGQHLLTALLSVTVIAVMALTLVKFRSTQNIAGAWPKDPLLSPTFVMLSMACLTCTADFITLGVHFCHGKVATGATRMVERIRSVMGILQAIAAAAGAGFFKYSETTSGGNDLWGYSCSDAADKMASVNSSGLICSSNGVAWWLALLQVVLHVLSFSMALWTMFKPGGSFQSNVEEASNLLADEETNETNINDTFGKGGA